MSFPRLNAANRGRLLLILLNFAIALLGILVLRWDLFGILYLFWVELILLGVFGVAKIVMALGGANFLTALLHRLFTAAGFMVLYGALLMLILSYSMVSFDLSTEGTGGNRSLGLGLIGLAVGFAYEFIGRYLLGGKFREAFALEEAFRIMIYALPLGLMVLFGIVPLAERAGPAANLVLVLGIVTAKLVLDLLLLWAAARWQSAAAGRQGSDGDDR